MQVQVNFEDDLMEVVVEGSLGVERQSEMLVQMIEDHQIMSRPALLWDMRKATVDYSPGDMQRYSGLVRRSLPQPRRRRKVAVLVSEPTAASAFLIFKTLMSAGPTEYRMFLEEPAARAWLAEPVSETT